ncbi:MULTISPECIES: GNAT family N-acetyltransferase [Luteimonas]|uniref:GNAT family N-acetyltransferase n=1 Tax=Luteimonas TaxID=83614 RepID=UPI0013044D4D|nr:MULTISPECIES: GNAT family N-acetyltransferase [Luteimonas]
MRPTPSSNSAATDTASFTAADLPSGRDYPVAVQLASRRMQLRGFGFRHALDLLQLGREERVTRMLLDDPIDTVEDAMGVVVWANKLYRERPGLGLWHTSDRAGRFLGMFSLTPSGDAGDIAIGVRLLPRAWGRGYAIEGGAALCAHAFDTLGLPQLIAQCAPDNRSVPPLLHRLGFVDAEDGVQYGNPARRFRLPRAEWQGLRPRARRSRDVASSGTR